MQTAKPFQLISIGVAILFAVIGLFVFAFKGSKPKPGVYQGPKVIVWGTSFDKEMKAILETKPDVNIIYTEKNKETLRTDYLEALASGTGPDVLLLPLEDVYGFKDRITTIPFQNYTERNFQDSFIGEASLLKLRDGYLGLPLAVDPLVMYFNRDHQKQQQIFKTPTTWSEILATLGDFTKVNDDFSISKSSIALGDFSNIKNAKEILSLLFLQSGLSISKYGFDNSYQKEKFTSDLNPKAGVGLNFYTQFVDPTKSTYTWNRSKKSSLDTFLAGDLTYYIGFGSDRKDIENKNPNLNFDIGFVPQSDENKTTYGKMYVLVLLNTSKNQTTALSNMLAMTEAPFAKVFSNTTGLPPVRLDLLSKSSADLYSPVLYDSAYYSKGWVDINPTETASYFKEAVDALTSGRKQTTDVVQTLFNEFDLLNQKAIKNEQ